jgi:hypothetical protein
VTEELQEKKKECLKERKEEKSVTLCWIERERERERYIELDSIELSHSKSADK